MSAKNLSSVIVPPPGDRSFQRATPLDAGRLSRVKCAFTTRRVDLSGAATVLSGQLKPVAGDLLLARVTRIRQHTRIELDNGRRARLHVGDEILVCYGNRYAPDQFESLVPDDLGPCHLVAAGGIASKVQAKHQRMKGATEIEPIGLIGDSNGRRINLRDARIVRPTNATCRPHTVAVVGTSMNAGKTTTAAHLIKGMDRAGLRVGAAKITGTGSGGDVWFMFDSGADPVLDFTDVGYATTFRLDTAELTEILDTLTAELASHDLDAIVLEIADGLMQQETATLLQSSLFAQRIDQVLFAAGDAMGAVAGCQWMQARNIPVSGISGALTASPLSVREVQQVLRLPVFDSEQLADPQVAATLVAPMPSQTKLRA